LSGPSSSTILRFPVATCAAMFIHLGTFAAVCSLLVICSLSSLRKIGGFSKDWDACRRCAQAIG
jgi:hypothetical protein